MQKSAEPIKELIQRQAKENQIRKPVSVSLKSDEQIKEQISTISDESVKPIRTSKEVIQRQAKENQREAAKTTHSNQFKKVQVLSTLAKPAKSIHTREELAKKAGISIDFFMQCISDYSL